MLNRYNNTSEWTFGNLMNYLNREFQGTKNGAVYIPRKHRFGIKWGKPLFQSVFPIFTQNDARYGKNKKD